MNELPMMDESSALIIPSPVGYTQAHDASHHNGPIDVLAAYKAGHRLGIYKATEGTGFTDSEFRSNWAKAEEVEGFYRMAYHYARDNWGKPADQLDHFLNTVGNDGIPRFVGYAFDAERYGNNSIYSACEAAVDMAILCRKAVGPSPKILIYNAPMNWPIDETGGADLWVANTYVEYPMITHGWNEFKIWQSYVAMKGTLPWHLISSLDIDYVPNFYLYVGGVTPPPPPPVLNKQAKCLVRSLKIHKTPLYTGALIGGLTMGQMITVEKEIRRPSEIWLKFLGEEKYVAMLYGGFTYMRYI